MLMMFSKMCRREHHETRHRICRTLEHAPMPTFAITHPSRNHPNRDSCALEKPTTAVHAKKRVLVKKKTAYSGNMVPDERCRTGPPQNHHHVGSPSSKPSPTFVAAASMACMHMVFRPSRLGSSDPNRVPWPITHGCAC